MGVPGLWDVLNKVGEVISLPKLAAIDGFLLNTSKKRAYRVGIDVSLWFYHAKSSVKGQNPELRGLFFMLANISKMPIIPLFVFDGRQRPKTKRGSKLGKSGSHRLSRQFKDFLDAFGMEWREAPGEAEAELAFLNREGHIDAVMTDDCDAFIFGARTVIKNWNNTLSGNKANPATNYKDKKDKSHTWIYKASDIENSPQIRLQRGGLILFALLSGGDYSKGVKGIGKSIAYRLAHCGFGDELLQAYQTRPAPSLHEFLVEWRRRVNIELKEGIPRTSVALPDTFPDLDILSNYAKPLHSGNTLGPGSSKNLALRDIQCLNLGRLGRLCEENFEWAYRENVIDRFSRNIWPGAVMHVLRRAALEADENEHTYDPGTEIGTPSSIVHRYLGKQDHRGRILDRESRISEVFVNRGPTHTRALEDVDLSPLICKIVGSREHTSTDAMLEYRIEILPKYLVDLTNVGILGTREPRPPTEEARQPKALEDPYKPILLWIPAAIFDCVHPSMVEYFILHQTAQGQKKGKGKNRVSSPPRTSGDETRDYISVSGPAKAASPSQSIRRNRSKKSTESRASHEDTTIVDPWLSFPCSDFRSNDLQANGSGFLFTCQDPDRAQFEDIVDLMEVDHAEDHQLTGYCSIPPVRLKSTPEDTSRRKRKAVLDISRGPSTIPKKPKASLLELIDAAVMI